MSENSNRMRAECTCYARVLHVVLGMAGLHDTWHFVVSALVAGEMFIFGYSFSQQPYVRAGMIDANGRMYKQVRPSNRSLARNDNKFCCTCAE